MQYGPQKLTGRQSQVLNLIRDHIEATGYPPTRTEISRELGSRSANSAEEHLKALARKGAIELIAGTSRGIRLRSGARKPSGLPVVGRVAAGNPILAQEHIEDYCDIAPSFFKPAADYFLKVRGDSMIDVGIHDNDLLAVHCTADVKDGDIVVVRIDDEVTVKKMRLSRDKYRIYLFPENPDYQPLQVDLREQEFAIEGLSVGVLRRGCQGSSAAPRRYR